MKLRDFSIKYRWDEMVKAWRRATKAKLEYLSMKNKLTQKPSNTTKGTK